MRATFPNMSASETAFRVEAIRGRSNGSFSRTPARIQVEILPDWWRKHMSKKMHATPMLDQLESGPWPSFVTGIKRLAKTSDMAVDLLGQLEHSYQTRKGYWRSEEHTSELQSH